MEYVATPTQLWNLSRTNKLMRSLITLDMVVGSGLVAGGLSKKSIENMMPSIRKRSIYVPTPRRLLRLIINSRCEFCRNESQFDKGLHQAYIQDYFYEAKSTEGQARSSSKPRVVRENFSGVRVCWDCLNGRRRMYVKLPGSSLISDEEDDWNEPDAELKKNCKKRVFHRLVNCFERVKMTKDRFGQFQFYMNGYYTSHRETLFRVFEHRRVVSYPYGVRETFNLFDDDAEVTHDRFELMWACHVRDSNGESVGPIFNRTMLSDLVACLESNETLTVDAWLNENVIDLQPSSVYSEFEERFDAHIERAQRIDDERRRKRSEKEFRTRQMHVDGAMQSISEIISFVNKRSLCGRTKHRIRHDHVRKVQRLLLCYRENQIRCMSRCIEYDTGNGKVDYILDTLLGDFLRVKCRRRLTPQVARRFAADFYDRWIEELSRMPIRAVTGWNNEVRTRFVGIRYRRAYVHKGSRHISWQDPSSFRRL